MKMALEKLFTGLFMTANTQNPKGVVDLVVSYNTTNQIVNYHVITVDVLNFDPLFLITGIRFN